MRTKDIVTTPVVSVAPETGVSEFARLLLERHIRAVPAIEPGGRLVGMVSEGDFLRRVDGDTRRHGLRDGKVVGIVSRADLLRGLAAQRDAPTVSVSVEDATIRKQILEEIRSERLGADLRRERGGRGRRRPDLGYRRFAGTGRSAPCRWREPPDVKGVELNISNIPAYAWGEWRTGLWPKEQANAAD